MRIKNIDGLSARDLESEVKKGGKFVYFTYIISLIIVTFRRTSGVYLVRGNEKVMAKSFPFTIVTFLTGWWGIPFGPRYTIESLRTNLRGGKDVTDEVMATVDGYILFEESQKKSA